jgi:hypothetical protein
MNDNDFINKITNSGINCPTCNFNIKVTKKELNSFNDKEFNCLCDQKRLPFNSKIGSYSYNKDIVIHTTTEHKDMLYLSWYLLYDRNIYIDCFRKKQQTTQNIFNNFEKINSFEIENLDFFFLSKDEIIIYINKQQKVQLLK